MRFTSWIIDALTHTVVLLISDDVESGGPYLALTFFADQGVIAVVGVVRISYCGAAAIAKGAEVEFWGR